MCSSLDPEQTNMQIQKNENPEKQETDKQKTPNQKNLRNASNSTAEQNKGYYCSLQIQKDRWQNQNQNQREQKKRIKKGGQK